MDTVNCRCNPLLSCRRGCPRCQAVPRGSSCPCHRGTLVETPLRNAMPRKPGPALPLSTWQSITDAFNEPENCRCKNGMARGYYSCPCHDDAPKEPGKPREWPYPIIGIPQDLPYVAYHEIGNHPEKPKPPVSSRGSSLLSEEFDKTMDEIRGRAMRVFGLTSAELGITEKDLEDTKHTNDVLSLLKVGAMSPSEARYHLGLPEKPKSISELSVKIEVDASPAINALKALRGASPDMLFVSPKDAERLFGLYGKPTSNTKESPMSISNTSNPVRDLADRAHELAQEGKVNLDSVKCAIDQGKQERKERIEKALSGAIELDMLKGPQGKQFVLKHFHRDQAYTTYGTAYPGYDTSEKGEEDMKADTVLLQGDTSPIVGDVYRTMRRLRKCLDDYGVTYVIKFFE
jgi:hypothetical protein